jgi:hypothetical protein
LICKISELVEVTKQGKIPCCAVCWGCAEKRERWDCGFCAYCKVGRDGHRDPTRRNVAMMNPTRIALIVDLKRKFMQADAVLKKAKPENGEPENGEPENGEDEPEEFDPADDEDQGEAAAAATAAAATAAAATAAAAKVAAAATAEAAEAEEAAEAAAAEAAEVAAAKASEVAAAEMEVEDLDDDMDTEEEEEAAAAAAKAAAKAEKKAEKKAATAARNKAARAAKKEKVIQDKNDFEALENTNHALEEYEQKLNRIATASSKAKEELVRQLRLHAPEEYEVWSRCRGGLRGAGSSNGPEPPEAPAAAAAVLVEDVGHLNLGAN